MGYSSSRGSQSFVKWETTLAFFHVWWLVSMICFLQTVILVQKGSQGMPGVFKGRVKGLGTRRAVFAAFCGVCGYWTRNLRSVKRHYLQHTGEKPFKCSLCAYAAARNDRLVDHIHKTHLVCVNDSWSMKFMFSFAACCVHGLWMWRCGKKKENPELWLVVLISVRS